jgi:hypothetical protein
MNYKNVIVKTENYEFAHGKKPRGAGCWYFKFVDNANLKKQSVQQYFGSYSVCKKKAQIDAMMKKIRTIKLLS